MATLDLASICLRVSIFSYSTSMSSSPRSRGSTSESLFLVVTGTPCMRIHSNLLLSAGSWNLRWQWQTSLGWRTHRFSNWCGCRHSSGFFFSSRSSDFGQWRPIGLWCETSWGSCDSYACTSEKGGDGGLVEGDSLIFLFWFQDHHLVEHLLRCHHQLGSPILCHIVSPLLHCRPWHSEAKGNISGKLNMLKNTVTVNCKRLITTKCQILCSMRLQYVNKILTPRRMLKKTSLICS